MLAAGRGRLVVVERGGGEDRPSSQRGMSMPRWRADCIAYLSGDICYLVFLLVQVYSLMVVYVEPMLINAKYYIHSSLLYYNLYTFCLVTNINFSTETCRFKLKSTSPKRY